MSRGDLSEVEWRILKVLLPVEREPGKRGRGRPRFGCRSGNDLGKQGRHRPQLERRMIAGRLKGTAKPARKPVGAFSAVGGFG